MGGMTEEWEDQSPSNSVGGEDEVESDSHVEGDEEELDDQEEGDEMESDNQEEESSEDAIVTNPTEGIEDLGALSTEVETGVAFDAATVEDKVVGAMMIEENVEVFTIESSLEWM